MKQSKWMSMLESIINIVVGFGISMTAQAVFLPMLGVPIPWHANFIFALIMTAISIVRSFTLRRLFEAMHIRRPLSPFVSAVIAERFRQIEQEGWSTEHDDQHVAGELARAGGLYAVHAHVQGRSLMHVPADWPWSRAWWKPVDFRRNLVKSAAMIIAEGEKFDRSKRKLDRELDAKVWP
jgi:hypothetical protein